ncbi:MAG TPA: CBS domain-containing protein [Gaiellaceae bacterium]|nr:CBS domain-containing protein [Gaiellaceae bacterium]
MARTVRDAMTEHPRTLELDATIVDAARAMRDADVGIVPVVEGDRLEGVITDRDIAVRVVAGGGDPNATHVRDAMSPKIVTIDPDQDLDEAMRLMAEHQVRRLPVCEEDGRLVGVLAQADVAEHGDEARTGETVQQISR